MKANRLFHSMVMLALCVGSFVALSCDDDDDYEGLKVSANKVEIAPAEAVQISVGNGTEPYTATSSDVKIATASVAKNVITITGVAEGKAAVLVSDNNKKTVSVGVEVKEAAAAKLTVGKTSVEVAKGNSAEVAISGGTEPYTASSKDETTATASVKDSKLTINGVKAGTTTITVADKNNNTCDVAVTVK